VKTPLAKRIADSDATAFTIGNDPDTASQIADFLADKKTSGVEAASHYSTETHIRGNVYQRRTVSDFGFIGWIIAQLANE
jgi:hypothetical protein